MLDSDDAEQSTGKEDDSEEDEKDNEKKKGNYWWKRLWLHNFINRLWNRRIYNFLLSLGKKNEVKNPKKAEEEDSEEEENEKEDVSKKKIVQIKNSVSRNKQYFRWIMFTCDIPRCNDVSIVE